MAIGINRARFSPHSRQTSRRSAALIQRPAEQVRKRLWCKAADAHAYATNDHRAFSASVIGWVAKTMTPKIAREGAKPRSNIAFF